MKRSDMKIASNDEDLEIKIEWRESGRGKKNPRQS